MKDRIAHTTIVHKPDERIYFSIAIGCKVKHANLSGKKLITTTTTTHSHTHTYTHIHTHVHIYTQMYTYTHMHTYTHTHTHTHRQYIYRQYVCLSVSLSLCLSVCLSLRLSVSNYPTNSNVDTYLCRTLILSS